MTDTNPQGLDLTEDRAFFGGGGLLHMMLCVPRSWDSARILAVAEAENPCGAQYGWQMGDQSCDCPDDPNRVHVTVSA